MRNLIVLSAFVAAASVQAATVAYWRFEGTGAADANTDVPKPVEFNGFNFYASIPDASGNNNALSVWEQGGNAGYGFRADVPAATIPQTGATNNLSVQNTGGGPAMFTDPAGPLPAWAPTAFTFEVSVKPENGGYRTFIGRDSRGGHTDGSTDDLAAMYFQARPDNSVAFNYLDGAGRFHNLISVPNIIRGWNPGTGSPADVPWQNLAAVSDGHTLTIWLDNGQGYYNKIISTDLGTGDTSLSIGTGTAGDWVAGGFSVGRGLYAGGHGDRAYGLLDEVRFSDVALTPSQFLFASPTATHAVLAPLAVTGWNQDLVINNGAPSYAQSITGTIDDGGNTTTGATFITSGNYPLNPDGIATDIVSLASGTFTAASGDTFQLQNFTGNNGILMTAGQSGTLTLGTPTSMTTLGLLGTSGNGPTSATVTVRFQDNSTTDYPLVSGQGITADWFNNGSNIPALPIGNRGTVVGNNIQVDNNAIISLYESRITLNAADKLKKVSSVTVANTGTGGTIAVMGLSGDAPATASDLKITSSSFNFTTHMLTLNFTSTANTVYRVTRSATLNGTDWTAIGSTVTATGASSTITVPFPTGTKDFFRVEVAP